MTRLFVVTPACDLAVRPALSIRVLLNVSGIDVDTVRPHIIRLKVGGFSFQ